MHVHIQFVRQLTRAVSTDYKTTANVFVSGLVVQTNLLIENDVGIVFRQTDDRCRNLVAGFHFIEETFAFLADQNRTTTTDCFRNQVGSGLFHSRMDLDFTHVHSTGTDVFQ